MKYNITSSKLYTTPENFPLSSENSETIRFNEGTYITKKFPSDFYSVQINILNSV